MGFSDIKPPSSFFKKGQPTRRPEVNVNSSTVPSRGRDKASTSSAAARHGQYSPTTNWRLRPSDGDKEKSERFGNNKSSSSSKTDGPKDGGHDGRFGASSASAKGQSDRPGREESKRGGSSKKKQIYRSIFGSDELSDEESQSKSAEGR